FNEQQIPPSSQHIIVSNNVFQYLSRDVQEQVILGSYNALRNGGVALFNLVGFTNREELEAIFEKTGHHVAFELDHSDDPDVKWNLSFRKEETSLHEGSPS